ncbi:MAG: hypothetical protein AMXMBFR56_42140 [Polyangiaceae bacterium]
MHEHDAPELQVDASLQVVFDHGSDVGEVARGYIPGGVLIDLPYYEVKQRLADTRKALEHGAKVIYEASFNADGVFVAVDILHWSRRGWTVTEVKSTTSVKPAHIPDAAIQTHVVRKAGLDVARTEVMHLNTQCRHPNLANLFTRADVTEQVEAELPKIPREVRRQLRMLEGPLPDVDIGDHCNDPYDCPFVPRCWPEAPKDHVGTLYKIGRKRVEQLLEDGYESIHDLPDDVELSDIADRQRRAVQSGEIVVEPGLCDALAQLEGPLAYLDFETVSLPIPVWQGCSPYDSLPVQFSCHIENRLGGFDHHEWLADGPDDPREALARALIHAVRSANTIVAYNASFELERIRELADALPHLASPLADIAGRMRDLLPIVRNHVYHPDFGGRFGLKRVLPALVPELNHAQLEIQDGGVATAELERLMFAGADLSQAERLKLRSALLAYCELDTWGLVKIVERLRGLAAAPARQIHEAEPKGPMAGVCTGVRMGGKTKNAG